MNFSDTASALHSLGDPQVPTCHVDRALDSLTSSLVH